MSTTLFALAGRLAEEHDLTRGAVIDAFAVYMPQIEALDGMPIDEGNVTDAQAEALTAAVEGWLENDNPRRVDELLDGIAEVSERVAESQSQAEMLASVRDTAICDALAAGAAVTDVSRASGLSRTSVYKIRDRYN